MEFSVHFTEEGRETLHKLHIENQNKVKQKLKELKRDLDLGKPLTGSLKGFFTLHVGKDRAIYSINSNKIIVHHVGKRKEIYDDLKVKNKV